MSLKFAVFGNPISHSKSPLIHGLFARQFNIELVYLPKLVDSQNFIAEVRDFFDKGGSGANVTLPFKLDAFQLADSNTPRALKAHSVNTLSKEKELIIGDNTDGVGLVTDLVQNKHYPIKDKRILIVGAGGAVRGILSPLLAQQPKRVSIYNRTQSKARQLMDSFPDKALQAVSIDALEQQAFDLIINATSASLTHSRLQLPETVYSDRPFCYDLAYGDKPTLFVQQAQQQSLIASDGLGMLVEQAAESFFIWHHQRPDTKPVIEAIHRQ